MGRKTRAELMSLAGILANNEEAQTIVRPWLDDWLQRTAKSWMWPVLKNRATNVPVSAGVTGLNIGAGDLSQTGASIHRLLNGVVMWRSQAGYSPNGRMLIRPFDAPVDPSRDFSVSDPAQRRGSPETCRVYTGLQETGNAESGSVTLVFDPVPNIPIYLAFDWWMIPKAIGASAVDDTEQPWYPSDRTLVEAIKLCIMDLDKGDEPDQAYAMQEAKVASMVVDDRDFDGSQAGDNEWLQLDPNTFR